jgi:hypothetical protein
VTIRISHDLMTLEVGGVIIASAHQRSDGRWHLASNAEPLDRNQAITALTITELIHAGCTRENPAVSALQAELRGEAT